jgi:similar to stage IV sporulation protein
LVLALVRYLKGYVLLEINGFFVEKFLNLCTNENILIWDIEKNGNGSVNLKMTIRAFKKIRRASYRTRTNVKILKKYGIKFFINNSKNRKGLAIGFILSFFMFVFLTSFIWSVDIKGNEKIKNEETSYIHELLLSREHTSSIYFSTASSCQSRWKGH